jgi:hypothetical protein
MWAQPIDRKVTITPVNHLALILQTPFPLRGVDEQGEILALSRPIGYFPRNCNPFSTFDSIYYLNLIPAKKANPSFSNNALTSPNF